MCTSTQRIVTSNGIAACGLAFCSSCDVGTYCNCYDYDQYYGGYGGDRRLEVSLVPNEEDSAFISKDIIDLMDPLQQPPATGENGGEKALYQVVRANNCDSCNSGSFCPGTGLGYGCPVGTFSSWGFSLCTPCAAGTYQPNTRYGYCFDSPAGNAILMLTLTPTRSPTPTRTANLE